MLHLSGVLGDWLVILPFSWVIAFDDFSPFLGFSSVINNFCPFYLVLLVLYFIQAPPLLLAQNHAYFPFNRKDPPNPDQNHPVLWVFFRFLVPKSPTHQVRREAQAVRPEDLHPPSHRFLFGDVLGKGQFSEVVAAARRWKIFGLAEEVLGEKFFKSQRNPQEEKPACELVRFFGRRQERTQEGGIQKETT